MDIDLRERRDLFPGCSGCTETDDGLLLSRFDEDNAWAGLGGFMQGCAAGIRIASVTDARRLRLALRLGPAPFEFGRGTVDVLVDDRTVYSRQPEGPCEDGQRFVVEVALPSGRKEVTVYLPTYRQAAVEALSLDGATFADPVRSFRGRILFIGDSITQGYGSSPADCYAARYARLTGRDFLNLGIGGACMPARLPETLRVDDCSEVVFAFGTNDANNSRKPGELRVALGNFIAFMKDRPPRVTIWSPVPWPQGEREGKRDSWELVSGAIRTFVAAAPTVRYVDGATILPWDDGYFVDGIHPNTVGMAMVAHGFCAAAGVR